MAVTMGSENPIRYEALSQVDPSSWGLLISAARAQKDRALADMDTYNSKYGSFSSSSPRDAESYDRLVYRPVEDIISRYEKAGVDWSSSPTARGEIRRAVASIPRDTLADLKNNALAYDTYRKNKQQAIANGTYDPDLDLLAHGGKDPSTWDTAQDGSFDPSVPGWQTFDALTKPYNDIFKQQQWSDDQGKIFTGGTPQDISSAIDGIYSSIPEAQREIMIGRLEGDGLSPADAEQYIKKDIESRLLGPQETGKVTSDRALQDKEALLKQQYRNQIALEGYKQKNRESLARMRGGGSSSSSSSSSSSGGSRGSTNDISYGAALLTSGLQKNFSPRELIYQDDMMRAADNKSAKIWNSLIEKGADGKRNQINPSKYYNTILSTYSSSSKPETATIFAARFDPQASKSKRMPGDLPSMSAAEGGGVWANMTDSSKLFTGESVVNSIEQSGDVTRQINDYASKGSRTFRFLTGGGNSHRLRSKAKKDSTLLCSTGNVITAPCKDGRIRQWVEVNIKDAGIYGSKPIKGYYLVYSSDRDNGSLKIDDSWAHTYSVLSPSRDDLSYMITDEATTKAMGARGMNQHSAAGDMIDESIDEYTDDYLE